MGEGKGETVRGGSDEKDDKGKGRLERGERKEERRKSGEVEREKGASCNHVNG